MRLSRYFLRTYKEAPKDAQTPSHILMHRAGMIQKLTSGIYNYLPLAQKTLKKIEAIIREELDKRDCQEVLMPAVQPSELWEESGRWNYYGPELLRFKDRKNADYCLGPTHEEVITDMVRRNVKSYKQLPVNLYQIQTKFRDEIRPRFGLMRGREFIMKDAYSFDVDDDESKKSYKLMYEAYTDIFNRCGLKFKAVDAATGAIGGDMSHEFQVLAETGEDEILSCSKCKYAANVEKAVTLRDIKKPENAGKCENKEVHTPNAKTIDEITEFLKKPADHMIKTLIYLVDDVPAAVLVRGDHEANEAKVQSTLGASAVFPADAETVKRVTGAEVGFAGPINLKEDIKILVDEQLYAYTDMVCGANKTDYHLKGVDPERDIKAFKKGDFTFAHPGDRCPHCDGTLESYRGIEVGQVFFLGDKYSKAMNCNYLDQNGKDKPIVMGCYGIGVSRTMAAAIEQNHDEYGIIWPAAIAPFEAVVVPLQSNKEEVMGLAEKFYDELSSAGIDTAFDDRPERAGFKMNDADLIGYPVQLILGAKMIEQGLVELKERATGEKREVKIENAVSEVKATIDRLKG